MFMRKLLVLSPVTYQSNRNINLVIVMAGQKHVSVAVLPQWRELQC